MNEPSASTPHMRKHFQESF